MSEIIIRTAKEEDAEELLEIYAPYVRETAITFEYEVPTVEDFRGRISHTLERYPYLVVEVDGSILGYAYAGPLKEREAYKFAVETTVYIAKDAKRGGLGRRLYEALEEALRQQGITNVYACIGVPREKDPYLTMDSVHFHEHMGYHLNGTFQKCGYKFDRWYDMVWMEKFLVDHWVD